MKKYIGCMAFAVSIMGLHGCGGSMLDAPDSERHQLVPEPMQNNEGRPRPSENVPVITTDGNEIIDATGEPVLLRGVNLQYGDEPLDRINGIPSIREVGSNVVRLQLRSNTTEDELEAALLTVVNEGLIAIISYWEPEVACAADDEELFSAVNNLWLDEWIDVLVQDRFQPHIMLNLASKWGPDGIFNSYSLGYRVYIDNYKAVIGQVRDAGFNNPIVIDAPGCGQDFHAFLGNRGRELLAADDEENIVLSVHAYDSRWRGKNEVASNMNYLDGEDIPVVMSEFGDVRMEEGGVKHTEIMVQAAGDYALDLPIDWQTEADTAAYLSALGEPLNIQGRQVSMEVYVDSDYVDSTMGMQMYMRDTEQRYANLGWNSASELKGDDWNVLSKVIQNESSLGYAEEGFDLTAVTHIGIELVANAKSPEVGGAIRIDNIKVIEASVPEALGGFSFDDDVDGWIVPWTDTQMSYEGGTLGLAPAAGSGEIIGESPALEGVSFDGEVQVSARVFVPASYAADTEGLYFKFFSNDRGGEESWQETNTLSQDQFTFGEWSEVTVSGNWAGGSKIGIQMGSLAGSTEPVLFDDIVVTGLPEEEVAVEWGSQYDADFTEGTDGWAYLSWENIPATISAEEGALVILPRPSEVDQDPSVSADGAFALQKNDLNSVEHFDLSSEKVEITLTIQLDEAYSSAPDDFELYLFMQDVNWQNHFNIAEWTVEDLTPGEWVTVTVEVDFPEEFDRTGTPQHFGFQGVGLYDMPDAPIRVSQFLIEGDVPVEIEEDVVELVDFHYLEHFERVTVDFVGGGLVAEDLQSSADIFERSKPFGWLAWSWIGNPEGSEVLDMSNSEDTSVDLTERGEQVVHGKGGIAETAVPANFPSTD